MVGVKHNSVLIIMLLLAALAQAQRIDVKDFALDVGATDAVKYPVRDANGTPCALVKVRLASYALLFEGDVVKTEYKGGGEHWVYMMAGATWVRVISSVAPPKDFSFKTPLVGNQTYILQLKFNESGQTTMIYRPNKVDKDPSYEWKKKTFCMANFSFPNAAFGMSYGKFKQWGWYFNMMLGLKGKEYVEYENDYLDRIAEERQEYDLNSNFHLIVGPVVGLTEDFSMYAGLGYTLGNEERLPGGFTMELGVMFNIGRSSWMSVSFENVAGTNGVMLPAIKLGIGNAWQSWF